MTEEVTIYLSNIGAILELLEAYITQISQRTMSLEVLARVPNSASSQELKNGKTESENVLRASKIYLEATRKAIQEIYNRTPDELREHLLEIKTAIIKSLELSQQEKTMKRTFEILLESEVLQDNNEDSNPTDPTTWSRAEFERILETLRKQILLNNTWITQKMRVPQNVIMRLPREG